MTGSFAMFDWLLIAVSFYVLYSGIVGKGKLYSVENIKEGMEDGANISMIKLDQLLASL